MGQKAKYTIVGSLGPLNAGDKTNMEIHSRMNDLKSCTHIIIYHWCVDYKYLLICKWLQK